MYRAHSHSNTRSTRGSLRLIVIKLIQRSDASGSHSRGGTSFGSSTLLQLAKSRTLLGSLRGDMAVVFELAKGREGIDVGDVLGDRRGDRVLVGLVGRAGDLSLGIFVEFSSEELEVE